jgi:hypothetical protein
VKIPYCLLRSFQYEQGHLLLYNRFPYLFYSHDRRRVVLLVSIREVQELVSSVAVARLLANDK